jgi:hypothetical protein
MLGLAHSASKTRVNALTALDPTYGLRAWAQSCSLVKNSESAGT